MPKAAVPITSPETVLRAFMRAMNDWEARCNQRSSDWMANREGDLRTIQQLDRDEYAAIFADHCSPTRALPRSLHFGTPPDYDPDNQPILRVEMPKPDRCIIYTEQNYGLKHKHVFTLTLEGDRWRIVRRERLIESGKKRRLDL